MFIIKVQMDSNRFLYNTCDWRNAQKDERIEKVVETILDDESREIVTAELKWHVANALMEL